MTEAENLGSQNNGRREGALPQPSVSVLFSYGIHLPETFGRVEELARNFFQRGKNNYLLLESGRPISEHWDFNQERSTWGSYKQAIVAVILRGIWKRDPKAEEVTRYSEEDFDKIRNRMDVGTWQLADLADQLEEESYNVNVQFESGSIEESRRAVQTGKENDKVHEEALEYARRGNYKKAAKRMGTNLARVAFNAKQRNRRFASQVIDLVEAAKKQHQESRILIRFGYSHPEISQTAIEKYQNEDGVSVVVTYDNENQPLPLPDLIIRKYYDGKTVTEIELARAVLYDIFMEDRAQMGEGFLSSAIEISNVISALENQKVYGLFAKLTREGIEATKVAIGLY